jgi:hypothetical protein
VIGAPKGYANWGQHLRDVLDESGCESQEQYVVTAAALEMVHQTAFWARVILSAGVVFLGIGLLCAVAGEPQIEASHSVHALAGEPQIQGVR